jgi:hypothetical protein
MVVHMRSTVSVKRPYRKAQAAAFLEPMAAAPNAPEDGSMARQHGGLGLGMAIVRHLVELHGGSVSAASAGKNQGAVFTVSLSVVRQAAGSNPPIERNESSDQRVGFVAGDVEPQDGIRV